MSLLSVPVHPLQTTCSSSSGQWRKGPSERGRLVDMYDVTTKYITTAMLVTDFCFWKLRGGLQPPQPPLWIRHCYLCTWKLFVSQHSWTNLLPFRRASPSLCPIIDSSRSDRGAVVPRPAARRCHRTTSWPSRCIGESEVGWERSPCWADTRRSLACVSRSQRHCAASGCRAPSLSANVSSLIMARNIFFVTKMFGEVSVSTSVNLSKLRRGQDYKRFSSMSRCSTHNLCSEMT